MSEDKLPAGPKWAIQKITNAERRELVKPYVVKQLHKDMELLISSMRDATYELPPDTDFDIVKAPWTKEQVKALEYWQESKMPFLASGYSPRDFFLLSEKEMQIKLIPTRAGWKSPASGKVVQKWARKFMFKLIEDDGQGFLVRGAGGAVEETGTLPSPKRSK